MLRNKALWIGLIIILVIGGGFLFYENAKLTTAHSTFDNYAAFRSCTTITSKTDTDGTCTTSSGENIKIVKFDNRWFLDGDLPTCGLHIGSSCLFNWP